MKPHVRITFSCASYEKAHEVIENWKKVGNCEIISIAQVAAHPLRASPREDTFVKFRGEIIVYLHCVDTIEQVHEEGDRT